MKFTIITHVVHEKRDNAYLAYAPYVKEMNLWLKHVDSVEVVAPLTASVGSLLLPYAHKDISFTKIPSFDFTSLKNAFIALLMIPVVWWKIFWACKRSDHIHLRCPGNIGLLGCFVQILFPKKIKTAKYAGNWDPKAKQPFSYRLQKRVLSNTALTKNMTAIVYGDWPHQTKNIKPFFTATYAESEKEPIVERDFSGRLRMAFVGTLSEGKRPLLAAQIANYLNQHDRLCQLDLFGEGVMKPDIEAYIKENGLENVITLHGNVDGTVIKKVLKETHFLILPSRSEGWPKVLAEAMFWGTIPVATHISCVPWMLGQGERGILIEPKAEAAGEQILKYIHGRNLQGISENAVQWSRRYTLDFFESEIVKLLGR